MQKQQAACHRLLSAFFFPLSSSHPGSRSGPGLCVVLCSHEPQPRLVECTYKYMYTRTRQFCPHILMIRQCYCGIMASDGETPRRDRRRQDGVNIPSLYPALLLITLGVSPIPDRSVLVLLRQVK